MSDVYLFLGGSWDGKRERVPDGRHRIKVAVPRDYQPQYSKPSAVCSMSSEWHEETYEKRAFGDHDKTLRVFVCTSVPKDGTMEMLIAGYRKP